MDLAKLPHLRTSVGAAQATSCFLSSGRPQQWRIHRGKRLQLLRYVHATGSERREPVDNVAGGPALSSSQCWLWAL